MPVRSRARLSGALRIRCQVETYDGIVGIDLCSLPCTEQRAAGSNDRTAGVLADGRTLEPFSISTAPGSLQRGGKSFRRIRHTFSKSACCTALLQNHQRVECTPPLVWTALGLAVSVPMWLGAQRRPTAYMVAARQWANALNFRRYALHERGG